jgi:hypothetical protein
MVKDPATQRMGSQQTDLIAGDLDHASELRVEDNALIIHSPHHSGNAVTVRGSYVRKIPNGFFRPAAAQYDPPQLGGFEYHLLTHIVPFPPDRWPGGNSGKPSMQLVAVRKAQQILARFLAMEKGGRREKEGEGKASHFS